MKEIQEQLEQLKQSINPTRELVASTFLDYLKVLNQKFLAGASFGMSSPAYKLSGSVDSQVGSARHALVGLPIECRLTEASNQRHTDPIQGLPDGDRCWAVVIGINTYSDSVLKGARKDAEDFAIYLRTIMRVPSDHIDMLVDDAATRDNILDSMYSLRNNERIKRGDAMIIYFSGHGSSYTLSNTEVNTADFGPPPVVSHPFWGNARAHARSHLQALVPVDRGSPDVPDISGRELNVCLADIRDAKGNNITVILDCCYSGGATRSFKVDQNTQNTLPTVGPSRTLSSNLTSTQSRTSTGVRYMRPLPAIVARPFASNMDARRARFGLPPLLVSISSPFWVPDLSSHVLVAACREDEVAQDAEEGGWFTLTMLDLLRELAPASHHGETDMGPATTVPMVTRPVLTYRCLGRALNELVGETRSQHPVVLGEHADSVLFQIRSVDPTRVFLNFAGTVLIFVLTFEQAESVNWRYLAGRADQRLANGRFLSGPDWNAHVPLINSICVVPVLLSLLKSLLTYVFYFIVLMLSSRCIHCFDVSTLVIAFCNRLCS